MRAFVYVDQIAVRQRDAETFTCGRYDAVSFFVTVECVGLWTLLILTVYLRSRVEELGVN